MEFRLGNGVYVGCIWIHEQASLLVWLIGKLSTGIHALSLFVTWWRGKPFVGQYLFAEMILDEYITPSCRMSISFRARVIILSLKWPTLSMADSYMIPHGPYPKIKTLSMPCMRHPTIPNTRNKNCLINLAHHPTMLTVFDIVSWDIGKRPQLLNIDHF